MEQRFLEGSNENEDETRQTQYQNNNSNISKIKKTTTNIINKKTEKRDLGTASKGTRG